MKVSYLQFLFPLTLFLGLGCSSDERSDEPGLDLEDNLPRSESERPLEGPDGDMDGDGIPNAQDPNPLIKD